MASEEELKRERGWYLGEATEEAALSVLQSCSRFNVFVVYNKPGGTEYTLATRVRMKDSNEDTFEYLQISRTESGLYQLRGQAEAKEDIVAAVNSYITGRDPPLTPALERNQDTHCGCSTEDCELCCRLCLWPPFRFICLCGCLLGGGDGCSDGGDGYGFGDGDGFSGGGSDGDGDGDGGGNGDGDGNGD